MTLKNRTYTHPTLSLAEVSSVEAAIDAKPYGRGGRDSMKFRALVAPDRYPDSKSWIEGLVWTDHKKSGSQVRPKLNRIQTELDRTINAIEAEGRPVRLAILKARRWGVSRYMLWRGLHRFTDYRRHRSQVLAIVANKSKVAGSLRDEAKHILHKMPYMLPVDRSNRQEIRLGFPWDTALRIDSADAGEPLRGETRGFRYLHCTESAYWKDPIKALTAINQAVPNEPGTLLTHESTGCGMNWWHDFWWAAERGENGYKALFYPWWYDPDWDYCDKLSYGVEQEFLAHLDDEERDLLDQGLVAGQLHWRRRAIRELCLSDPNTFRQEYPSIPQEAFLPQGSRLFSAAVLTRASEDCMAPIATYRVRPSHVGANGKMVFALETVAMQVGNPNGLLVWAHPDPTHSYVIGADSSEGVGADRSVAQVIDYHTGEQVACFVSDAVAPMDFGRILACLGWHYNEAFLMPERNAHGNAVIASLAETGYPKIARMVVAAWARRSTQVRTELGWNTNSDTRPRAFGQLRQALAEGTVVIRDQEFIREASAMYLTDKGRYDHPKNMHDDRVDALAIAIMAVQLATVSELLPVTPQRRWGMTADEKDIRWAAELGKGPTDDDVLEPVEVLDEPLV